MRRMARSLTSQRQKHDLHVVHSFPATIHTICNLSVLNSHSCQNKNPPPSKPNSSSTSTNSAANPSCAKPAPTSAALNSTQHPPTTSSTPSAAATSKPPT